MRIEMQERLAAKLRSLPIHDAISKGDIQKTKTGKIASKK